MPFKFAVLLGLLFCSSSLWAQFDNQIKTVAIPLPNASKSVKKPASDLLKDGQVLDVGVAAQMAQGGFDLSTLNPTENKMWQDKVYPASDAGTRNYPKSAVQFLSFEATGKFTHWSKVRSSENPNAFFRLSLSRFSQPMMMRAALLRKLGYFVPSPRFYSNIKVSFKSEEEKQAFVTQAEQDLAVDMADRKWISVDNTQDHSLTLISAVLEDVSFDYFDFQWGIPVNPDDPNQLSLVQRLSRNRAYRALLIPFNLVDVPESVNRFSTRFGTVNSGFVSITYFLANSFQACGYDDAQWILKRLQKLTLKDYQEIVAEAHYPTEIAPLVLAKLVNRAQDSLSLFGLKPTLAEQNMDISSGNGIVVSGKVMEQKIAGYPQRFAHGDRTSPFQPGDFGRYLTIEGKTSALSSMITQFNKNLQIFTVDQAAQRYQQESYQRIIDHFRSKPREPFYREVRSWGGPIAGFNVNASRHVSTGTYAGSTAPLQLVDNMSVSAALGMFRALDGYENVIPVGGANVSIVRDYTHVRPLPTSVKDANQEGWKNLLIPSYMKNISQVLKSVEKVSADGSTQQSLDAFLNDLRDGEVFSITDSVALSAYLQASASLDVLLGFTPFSFINSVTLGADASRVILRQVSFHRVVNGQMNGVHVYVREMKNKSAGVEMNVNFFLNLLKIRAQTAESDITSDGFLIDYNPANSKDAAPDSEIGKKLIKVRDDLRVSLLSLFEHNETEPLYSKFQTKKFVVQHNLKEKEVKFKFLAWKISKFKEDHIVNITYPKSEKHPELDPNDEKVTLFTSKRGELHGTDLLGLGYDLGDALLSQQSQGKFKIARGIGDNPANSPMGKAYWRVINTEADLSKNSSTIYPSVGMIQHVWGGWSLKRDAFLTLVDKIKKQFENTEIANYELIKKSEFVNVKSLDFYRITANLSILQPGLDRLRNLILQPDSVNPDGPKSPLMRFVKRMRCKNLDNSKECESKTRYTSDQDMYKDLLTLIGNGDYETGKRTYIETCEFETRKNQDVVEFNKTDYYKGNNYNCLTSWMIQLIKMAHNYPTDKADQTRWMTALLALLDEKIPLPQLLKYLGSENYIFLVRFNGFRVGDEDGDQEYFSNSVGDPKKDYQYAGGLVNLFIKKTGLMPTELDRTLGGFQ